MQIDNKLNTPFSSLLQDTGKVNINSCYQCFTCTLSCPVTFRMDFLPHQVVKMVQLGKKSEVLQCSTIWQCVSCETCLSRCPNGIDIPRLMDELRYLSIKERTVSKKEKSPVFNRIFLEGIKQNGIQYELGMMLKLKLLTGDYFSDLIMGMKMLLKGKLNMLPHRIKGYLQLKDLFRKSEAGT